MEYPKSLTPWYAPLSKAWFSGMPLLVKCLSFEVKTDVEQGCLLSSFLFPSVINGSLGGYHKQEQSYIMDILNATWWSRICRWPGIYKSQPQSDAGQNISSCNQNSSKRTLCQHEENRATLSNSLWWAHKRSWVICLSNIRVCMVVGFKTFVTAAHPYDGALG